MGLIAGALIGGSVIAAGGAVAAGAMQSDATRKANAATNAATKKYMKLASAEAERGYGDMIAAVNKLGGAQSGLSKTYFDNTDKTIKAYDSEVNKALGNFPDYYTGVSEVFDKANQNVDDLEARSKTVVKESADQAYDYNLSRFQDFTNFASRLSQENQKIRLDLARTATPKFDEIRSQMALNDLQGAQGIMSASTEAAITRAAAQRGLASGVGAGSPLKLNLELRDIGLFADAEKNAAAERFQRRQLQDYNTLVAGTQVGVENVYDWMGLNTNKVIDVNNENSWKLFQAQKVPLDYKMVGLNTSLDYRGNAAINKMSSYNAAFSNIYGQESDTARAMAAMEAAAAEARTNAKLGIAGQGLSNAYASANRTMASGLANAQLVSSTSSQIGGSLMGFGMSAYGAGLSGAGGGAGATASPNSAGFYNSAVAGANAYQVAPNQLSYQKPSGGFLGFGGTPGGYYYNA